MQFSTTTLVLVSSLALYLPNHAHAQSRFATAVVQFNQGTGGGIFNTANILGGPQGAGLGAGSLNVLTLGDGGSAVLGFDTTIVDGPGADFTVFENGFVIGSGPNVFAEIAYVEVSSDGATFARFPSRFLGPGSKMGALRGLAGGLPVLSNVLTNSISPLDAVVSGGEAFDLADLANHPTVLAGQVNLAAIGFVRLVDCLPTDLDSLGSSLPGSGGADFDAIAVLNAGHDPLGSKPFCDLSIDPQGRIVIELGDPQGFADLDLLSLRASIDLVPFDLLSLASLFQVTAVSPEKVTLSSPMPPAGLRFALGLSTADLGGLRSTDQVMVQG
jgi:hypothetical protein